LPVCLWLVSGPILRGAAAGLVVEDDLPDRAAAWLVGGEGAFDAAAGFYQEGRSPVILVARPGPDRLVRLGVLPAWETIVEGQLVQRGVPRRAVEFRGAPCRDEWDAARALGAWLAEHPRLDVILLCDRFESRARRVVLRRILGPGPAGRIHFMALPDCRYDENDWWTSRTGVKEFFNAWLGLLYARLVGEPPDRAEPWDPDRYESELAKRLGSGRS
jgi:hypothetical protein